MICYEYINEYIRHTIKRNPGILHELEEYAAEHYVPIIQPEVAKFLQVLGSLHKPARILEVGTAIGYSAILMAGFLPEGGILDTIEIDEDKAELAKSNIRRAGLENTVHVIIGDALDVLRYMDKQYDMVFLDAAKGQYGEFYSECMRMLRKGGLLVSDNILYKGMVANDQLVVHRKKTIVTRMREYLDTLCSNEELETSIIPIGDGVAVSVKIS